MFRNLKTCLMSLLLCFIMPVALIASDSPDAAGEQKTIFDGGFGPAIFAVLLFLLLFFFLKKFAWKPLLEGLQEREKHIKGEIDHAEKANADAKDSMALYQKKLEDAAGQVDEIIAQGRIKADQIVTQMHDKAKADISDMHLTAKEDIKRAKADAVKDIHRQTVDLATDLAGRIVGRSLNASDHRDLLDKSLDKLEGKN